MGTESQPDEYQGHDADGDHEHEGACDHLRRRRIERVRLHVDLTILAQLATALAKAKAAAVPLAA